MQPANIVGDDDKNYRIIFKIKRGKQESDTIFQQGQAKMSALRGRVRRYSRIGFTDFDLMAMLNWSRKDLRTGRMN